MDMGVCVLLSLSLFFTLFFFVLLSTLPSVILFPFVKPLESHQRNKLRRIMGRRRDSCNHAVFLFFSLSFMKKQPYALPFYFFHLRLFNLIFLGAFRAFFLLFFSFFQPHLGVSRGLLFLPIHFFPSHQGYL